MPGRTDPLRIAMHVAPYVAFYFLFASLAGPLLLWLGGYLGAAILTIATGLFVAAFSYRHRHRLWLELSRP